MIYDEVQRYGMSVCGYFNLSKRQKQKVIVARLYCDPLLLLTFYHLLIEKQPLVYNYN